MYAEVPPVSRHRLGGKPFRAALVAALAFAIGAFSPIVAPANANGGDETFTISGNVIGPSGPVVGIGVEVAGFENPLRAVTSADGAISFTVTAIETPWLITVGYDQNLETFPFYQWQKSFNSLGGDVTLGNIELTPAGPLYTLTLTISDAESPNTPHSFEGSVEITADAPEPRDGVSEFLRWIKDFSPGEDISPVDFVPGNVQILAQSTDSNENGFSTRGLRLNLSENTTRNIRLRASVPEPTGIEKLNVTITAVDGVLGQCAEVTLRGPVTRNGFEGDPVDCFGSGPSSDAVFTKAGDTYTYRFEDLPAGVYSVRFGDRKADLGTYSTLTPRESRVIVEALRNAENEVLANEHNVDIRVFNIEKTRAVTGTFVVDGVAPGNVFDGLEVAIEPQNSGLPIDDQFAEIEPDGSFEMSGLPYGRYVLYLNNFDGPPWFRFIDDVEFVLNENDPAVVTLTLPPLQIEPLNSGRSLQLTIQDRVSHRPIDGLEVRISHRDSYFTQSATTMRQSDGRVYALFTNLPSGEFFVTTDDDRTFLPNPTVVSGDSGQVRVRADQFTLNASVTGLLVDPFGSPIAGSISVLQQGREGVDLLPGSAMADSDGEFEGQNWPSGIPLIVEFTPLLGAIDVAPLRITVEPLTPNVVTDLGEITLPFGTAIQGILDGLNPLARYSVEVFTPTNIYIRDEGVDADGYFRIENLPLGPVKLGIRENDETVGGTRNSRPLYISNENGSYEATNTFAGLPTILLTRAELDLGIIDMSSALGEPVRSVTGQVRVQVGAQDSNETIPLPRGRGIRLELLEESGGELVPTFYNTVATPDVTGLDNGGTFVLPSVPPGEYVLRFRDATRSDNRGFETLDVQIVVPVIEEGTPQGEWSIDLGRIAITAIIPVGDIIPVTLNNVDSVSDFEDFVSIDGQPAAGQLVTLEVGEDMAGEWVLVVANSDPEVISDGWVRVGADGKVSATIPATLPTNISHRLAIQDADLALTGWTRLNLGSGTTPQTGTSGSTKKRSSIALSEAEELAFSSPFVPRQPSGSAPATKETDGVTASPEMENPYGSESTEEVAPEPDSYTPGAIARDESGGSSIMWLWIAGGAFALILLVTVVMLARRASAL